MRYRLKELVEGLAGLFYPDGVHSPYLQAADHFGDYWYQQDERRMTVWT